jgi:hypothetical protein
MCLNVSTREPYLKGVASTSLHICHLGVVLALFLLAKQEQEMNFVSYCNVSGCLKAFFKDGNK